MEPTLKQLRAEVAKVKKMFLSDTHKMTREECNLFLHTYKDLYKPIVRTETPKIKPKREEEYDF